MLNVGKPKKFMLTPVFCHFCTINNNLTVFKSLFYSVKKHAYVNDEDVVVKHGALVLISILLSSYTPELFSSSISSFLNTVALE